MRRRKRKTQREEMILNLIWREKPKDCQEEKGECEYLSEVKMVVKFLKCLWLGIVCLLLYLLNLKDLLSS